MDIIFIVFAAISLVEFAWNDHKKNTHDMTWWGIIMIISCLFMLRLIG